MELNHQIEQEYNMGISDLPPEYKKLFNKASDKLLKDHGIHKMSSSAKPK